MSRFICVLLLVISAFGCGSSGPAGPSAPVPSPSPAPASGPTPRPTTPIVLTGRVTDFDTAAPISGALVSINGRYAASTDNSGNYAVNGVLDAGGTGDFTYVSANNYTSDYRYIRGTTQDVRLHRLQRITAGDSTTVTIAPDDSLCVNNFQDTLGLGPDYVCRSIRVVAPVEGLITTEAFSSQGAHPPLEVETVGVQPCCSERMGNPISIQVKGGTEIVVNVEMLAGSSSQQFTVSTSMSRP